MNKEIVHTTGWPPCYRPDSRLKLKIPPPQYINLWAQDELWMHPTKHLKRRIHILGLFKIKCPAMIAELYKRLPKDEHNNNNEQV